MEIRRLKCKDSGYVGFRHGRPLISTFTAQDLFTMGDYRSKKIYLMQIKQSKMTDSYKMGWVESL